MRACRLLGVAVALLGWGSGGWCDASDEERGVIDAERNGTHDAANIRTVFYNYGMVGDYPPEPLNVDLSVFHSAEAPKGSGMNYTDGITPFVLAKIEQRDGTEAYIMETGYRERQARSPERFRIMRFEPRPGFFEEDNSKNLAKSPAISSDRRTWPAFWPDKLGDPDDPGWSGHWNGYFGKRAAADQESYMVLDDDFYDAWDYQQDSLDATRHGLGLRVAVRGFQWANPQARNVIFWHYDITNEGTTDYNENIIFGLYMDSGVGGSALSCDGVAESDDDNAYFDRKFDQKVINLVYTWDKGGHGRDLSGGCGRTGYLGYAYLETPGKPYDGEDNDEDGITDERRDGGPGQLIQGREAILAEVAARYDLVRFERVYGDIERLAAYRTGIWWTGDEDLDWDPELHDTGADGVFDTGDTGENDGVPTPGEANFDRTDLHESDQIGLTGFKMNRIRAGVGNPSQEVDDIVFFTDGERWPQRLYEKFSHPDSTVRFDPPLASNYNIGFFFASGPFTLRAGQTERFSLALAYGGGLDELRRTVQTVQVIYDANYQFAVPPPVPTLAAETGDGFVRLSWDDLAERGIDPVTGAKDFEGYRVYRATDPDFLDARVITTGTGSDFIGNGRPVAQFDLKNGKKDFSDQTEEGVAYYLGKDSGLTHTWTDSTVTNGQEYYYAVAAYDYGPVYKTIPDTLKFYPSENSIAVSRTPRGGLILPSNVVVVRPEPKAMGYFPAQSSDAVRLEGDGTGTVRVEVVNSNLVPNDHLFRIDFALPHPDSIRASSYSLSDSTEGVLLFKTGTDLSGLGAGPVASGLLPVIQTRKAVEIDTLTTGFTAESQTDKQFKVSYISTWPPNLRREGYPEDLSIIFDDDVVETSLPMGRRLPALPAKFKIYAHTPAGDREMDFIFVDEDGDGTLGGSEDRVDVVRHAYEQLPSQTSADTLEYYLRKMFWRIVPDTVGTRLPGRGDVYRVRLLKPFGEDDAFLFSTKSDGVNDEAAAQDKPLYPYVVPNPYVAAASFEPERFAVSGRGERRLEFRGLPRNCTIRIYTVHGELVRTLRHDGSDDGMVPWDLRTKDNLDVAPGLYVFHVDGGKVGTHLGKFAIIK